jgi:hypothetical protein
LKHGQEELREIQRAIKTTIRIFASESDSPPASAGTASAIRHISATTAAPDVSYVMGIGSASGPRTIVHDAGPLLDVRPIPSSARTGDPPAPGPLVFYISQKDWGRPTAPSVALESPQTHGEDTSIFPSPCVDVLTETDATQPYARISAPAPRKSVLRHAPSRPEQSDRRRPVQIWHECVLYRRMPLPDPDKKCIGERRL